VTGTGNRVVKKRLYKSTIWTGMENCCGRGKGEGLDPLKWWAEDLYACLCQETVIMLAHCYLSVLTKRLAGKKVS